MGPSSSDIPDFPSPADSRSADRFGEPFPERFNVPLIPLVEPKPEPITRYVVLFLLTCITTTAAGALTHGGFRFDPRTDAANLWTLAFFIPGLWYSVPILAILGAHEFGHYFACRHYGVDASLPYFLPVPLPPTGTVGAVIRIRQPLPSKRALFDVGIAGPIAGFLVAIPVLVIGISLSQVAPMPIDSAGGFQLGEPLLFKTVSWMVWGNLPEHFTLTAHPMAFAAWFGLLATALNLLPMHQLDGGHIAYAVIGRKSTFITFATFAGLVGLIFVSRFWVLWTVVTLGMIMYIGPHHPRTVDDHTPVDRARLWLAAFAVLMFVLCFTPTPIIQP